MLQNTNKMILTEKCSHRIWVLNKSPFASGRSELISIQGFVKIKVLFCLFSLDFWLTAQFQNKQYSQILHTITAANYHIRRNDDTEWLAVPAVLMTRVTFVATIKMCDYNKLDNIVEKNHSHTEPWSTIKKKLQELEYKTSTCLLMWSGCVLLVPCVRSLGWHGADLITTIRQPERKKKQSRKETNIRWHILFLSFKRL